jgi:hypothetical protein
MISNELIINVMLGVIGFLIINLLRKLEKGNESLARLEVEIAKLNITVQGYDKEITSLKEWQISQDKEILKLRERQHDLADKLQIRFNKESI